MVSRSCLIRSQMHAKQSHQSRTSARIAPICTASPSSHCDSCLDAAQSLSTGISRSLGSMDIPHILYPMTFPAMASQKYRLCRTCAALFDNPQTEDFQYEGEHHANDAELELSADRGCYICVRLRIEVHKTPKSQSTRPRLRSSQFQVTPTHDLREWKLDFDLELGDQTLQAHFVVLDHLRYPQEDFRCQISPNTLDPNCM